MKRLLPITWQKRKNFIFHTFIIIVTVIGSWILGVTSSIISIYILSINIRYSFIIGLIVSCLFILIMSIYRIKYYTLFYYNIFLLHENTKILNEYKKSISWVEDRLNELKELDKEIDDFIAMVNKTNFPHNEVTINKISAIKNDIYILKLDLIKQINISKRIIETNNENEIISIDIKSIIINLDHKYKSITMSANTVFNSFKNYSHY